MRASQRRERTTKSSEPLIVENHNIEQAKERREPYLIASHNEKGTMDKSYFP